MLGQPSEQNPERNNDAAARLFPPAVRNSERGQQLLNMNGGRVNLTACRPQPALRPPLASMNPIMRSSPSLFLRFVITNGRSPRIRRASVSIFSSEAPT